MENKISLANKLNFIYKKIKVKEELTEEELAIVEGLIPTNDSSLQPLYEYFICNAILKKKNVSYKSFRLLIQNYVQLLMSEYIKNPTCLILDDDLDEEIIGCLSNEQINIAEQLVRRLYYEGSCALISLINHEITHVWTFARISINDNSEAFIIKEIEDLILSQSIPGYYKTNYKNISFELEANYYEIIYTIKWLESKGFAIQSEFKAKELERAQQILCQTLDTKRFINGEETTLDKIFDEYIENKPELLDSFPQLQFLYKQWEDGKVYAKTQEELIDDYNDLMDNWTLNAEEKEKYKKLYSYLINYRER